MCSRSRGLSLISGESSAFGIGFIGTGTLRPVSSAVFDSVFGTSSVDELLLVFDTSELVFCAVSTPSYGHCFSGRDVVVLSLRGPGAVDGLR